VPWIRKSLIATAIALVSLTTPVLSKTDVNVGLSLNVGPPPPVVEAAPPPPPGYIWAPGYWYWDGHRHVWRKGHFVRERPGWVWEPPHWVERRGRWVFVPGHWAHV
jgi:hypothetical protein